MSQPQGLFYFLTHYKDLQMDFTLRRLKSHADYETCVHLQKETWGENFSENVPPALLMVAQKLGGVAAGAFDANNNLLGFVFGLTGIMSGRLVNWSHMLAVKTELRGFGIGGKLKLFQRELLLEQNIKHVYWTYDPLVARNAHLNINKLGVNIQKYVPEMYLDDNGSDLHRGIGMDRFIVEWQIAEPRVQQIISGQLETVNQSVNEAPVINSKIGENGSPVPVEAKLPALPSIRIEIPANIETIQNESLPSATKWRTSTKRAFLHYLGANYTVEAFFREPESNRCFYVLTQ